jgi:TRAP transporter TAXI family solute receptor
MNALERLRDSSRIVLALVAITAAGAVLATFWLLFHYVRPAPPRMVTMLTGAPGGAYALHAERYRAALAREGIALVLRPTSGSVENLLLLKTAPDADLAFIQSGIANEPDSRDLVMLGSMYFEPVWLFHRLDTPLERLTQLGGLRVGVGGHGSGTQLMALQLLTATGMPISEPGWKPVGDAEAADALIDGRLDAAFMIAGADAPTVQKLLATPGVRLATLTHAEAYARRIPQLATHSLPAGAIDLAAPNPPVDMQVLGTTANLVARADLHPAIVNLIMGAAREIHGQAGLFQDAGEYPYIRTRDLPPSSVAQRYLSSGPSFFQRYLPFWLAVMADRLLVSLLPLVALLIPLMRIAPALYAWRMRARVYRWYGELKFLEHGLREQPDAALTANYLAQLDRIEEHANQIRVPLAYSGELYTLREHIQLVRYKLRDHVAANHGAAAPAALLRP